MSNKVQEKYNKRYTFGIPENNYVGYTLFFTQLAKVFSEQIADKLFLEGYVDMVYDDESYNALVTPTQKGVEEGIFDWHEEIDNVNVGEYGYYNFTRFCLTEKGRTHIIEIIKNLF